MSVPKALHSRASDEWWTPPEVFDPLNEEFGFTLDVCAGSAEASRCPTYLWCDGLTFDWSSQRDVTGQPVVAWCNPPYSSTAKWIQKAWQEMRRGVTTVMLINNITETEAWRTFIMPDFAPYIGAAEVRFVAKRVHFIAGCDMAGLKKGERGPAPKGSVVVVFRPGHVGPPVFSVFHQRAREVSRG